MTSPLDPLLGGGRGRLINLKFTGELENSPIKLLTNFQPAKLTHLGLIQIFNCVHLSLPEVKKQTFKTMTLLGDKKTHTKKVSSRKSNVGTPKRILVKNFLKNSHYFYLSNETNRLRPSILLVGRSLKMDGETNF